MCVCLYLHKAAHHILIKHWQTGPAFAVYVQSVYRHDDGLGLGFVHHQNVDSAVAQTNRGVCHPEGNREKFRETHMYLITCAHTHTLSPFNFGVINVVTGQEDYCGLKLGPSQQLNPHSRTNKAVLSQNLEKGDSKDCSQTDQSTVCFQCVELLTCINYFVFL